ncbi:MAG TPA: transcriptional regulator [Candidatus Saccharimonadia bacterium]|nr:transcriptional regulator [Candidatus Saccharimonadia bacterium]
MVEQLFGSKTRVKLLSLFFNNPGRPFYVREITRKIDEQINSVRRELANLLSVGLVSSDGSNNRLYYEVNPKYEYYEQLRSIFTSMPAKSSDPVVKETREEDKIIKRLRSTGSISFAFLTGSFARDSRTNVDIFVVGDINKARLAKVVAEMEKEMGRELNYSALTPDEYQYRLSLNDRFITTVLEARKIVIIDGQEKPLAHSDVTFGEYVPVAIVTAATPGRGRDIIRN